MKIGNVIIAQKKRIELGKGHIEQYTIFECKQLGGIWIYNWKTIDQNRFHTHAFNSVAFTLRGSYIQEVITDDGIEQQQVRKLFKPRCLPRNYTHRILDARPNTWTCVFFGRWSKHWYEYFDDTKTWVQYTWNRKKVAKFVDVPYKWICERIKKES
jgi:hypothetical protein